MGEQITVCLVQPDLVWEDIEANLRMMEGTLTDIKAGTDLIILPETFSTGFTMRSTRFAEDSTGKAVTWMHQIALKYRSYVTGSVIIRENERIYNRLYWISPSGIEGHYDKRHLFRMGREDENFVPGEKREIFTLGSFRFFPQICYDLRFPVFCRNRGDYDVLFYVANWPAPRQLVWETMSRARAIENQAYVLAVNRVGIDGMGVDHAGGTCAIDPMGNEIFRAGDHPGIHHVILDLEKVVKFREKFPVWKDADQFSLEN